MRDLLNSVLAGWGNASDLFRTVLAAEARWALDHGRPISPSQLAALARVILKSIRNWLNPLQREQDPIIGEW